MIRSELIKDLSCIESIDGEIEKSWMEISIDTRDFKKGLFVAITGENFNAVRFLDDVIKEGCKYIVFSSSVENKQIVKNLKKNFTDITWIEVENAITFLQELSSIQTKLYQSNGGRVVGISGSNGKTTHKEMISHILDSIIPNKVVKTYANNNNHIGVPLTLLDIQPNTKVIVVEFGSNHPGEMKVVCDIARPKIGITTNIGSTHLEFFESEESVFDEESYLYEVVKNQEDHFFLINNDDQYLNRLDSSDSIFSYGVKSNSHFRFEYIDNGVLINFQGTELIIRNDKITGKHNFQNLVASILICLNLFPENQEKILTAAKSFSPSQNRSQWLDVGNTKVFLDAYNANPSSMKTSIEGFFEYCERVSIPASKCAVILGDMNELGEGSDTFHVEMGKYTSNFNAAKVIYIGRFSKLYQQGHNGECSIYASTEELGVKGLGELANEVDAIFIKGSRSLQLESLIDIT